MINLLHEKATFGTYNSCIVLEYNFRQLYDITLEYIFRLINNVNANALQYFLQLKNILTKL